jgi:hypothetical protein
MKLIYSLRTGNSCKGPKNCVFKFRYDLAPEKSCVVSTVAIRGSLRGFAYITTESMADPTWTPVRQEWINTKVQNNLTNL